MLNTEMLNYIYVNLKCTTSTLLRIYKSILPSNLSRPDYNRGGGNGRNKKYN